MANAPSFDPIWEDAIYSAGQQLNRYPYDAVVSFVYRNYPRQKPRSETTILEVGCGAGNNLWFAAREGFRVIGLDASRSAVAYARERFRQDGLEGAFEIGDFTRLPFPTAAADLAIDRVAITCCGRSDALEAVAEVGRVLRTAGRFFFNCYSDRHTSATAGRPASDGVVLDINGGTLVGVGQIRFYSQSDVRELFRGWKTLSLQHVEWTEHEAAPSVHAEWRAVFEKT